MRAFLIRMAGDCAMEPASTTTPATSQNTGRSIPGRLTPDRLIPSFTSANESFVLVNQLTCFHRPPGTVKKELLPNSNKTRSMQNHPGGWGIPQKNQTQRGFGPVSA